MTLVCSVRIHDLHDLQQLSDILKTDDSDQLVDQVQWTDDGRLLAMSTHRGSLHVYLTKLPLVGASHKTCIAYLTALNEVEVQECIPLVTVLTMPVCISIEHCRPRCVLCLQTVFSNLNSMLISCHKTLHLSQRK